MRPRLYIGAICVCFAAACGFEASLGPADGVRSVRIEEDMPNPALVDEGLVVLTEDIEILSASDSAHYRNKFGDDKIGALRGVTLELVEIRIEGLDLARSSPPQIFLWDQRMDAVVGAEIELDDPEVDAIRAAMLGETQLLAPLALSLDAPLDALDATRPELHIVLVVQPTLRIDVASAL